MADIPTDRAALIAEIRAHLSWEAELGGSGIPRVAPQRHAQAEHPSAAPQPVNRATAVVSSEVLPDAAPRALPPQAFAPQAAPPQAAGPALQPGAADKHVRLTQLAEQVRGCTRCELAKGRTQTVFARGNPDSPLVFVGEGPGQEEDLRGLPFVGAAGQLLDKMIAAMGFGRDDVYICNVVKCRPPGNRTPLPSEAGACAPFLNGQLEAVAPRVIVALGRCAAENMGLVPAGGGWRGRWGSYRGVDVMPTYHPAFLLRSPEFKRPVWEDLQKVMARLKSCRAAPTGRRVQPRRNAGSLCSVGKALPEEDDVLLEVPGELDADDEVPGTADAEELMLGEIGNGPEDVGLDTDTATEAGETALDTDEDESETAWSLDDAPIDVDAELDVDGDEHGWTDESEGSAEPWDDELSLDDESQPVDDGGLEGVEDTLLDGLIEEHEGSALGEDDEDDDEFVGDLGEELISEGSA